jgi:hypothetical protein
MGADRITHGNHQFDDKCDFGQSDQLIIGGRLDSGGRDTCEFPRGSYPNGGDHYAESKRHGLGVGRCALFRAIYDANDDRYLVKEKPL